MELLVEDEKKITTRLYSYYSKKEREEHIKQMETESWHCVQQLTGTKGDYIIEAVFEMVEI